MLPLYNFRIVLFVFLLGQINSVQAQLDRYLVKFRDKGQSPYTFANPAVYLSQKAIQQRQHFQIPIDSLDIPIHPDFLDSLQKSGNVTILASSKWMNQVAIQTSDIQALQKIISFPFVRELKLYGKTATHQIEKHLLEDSILLVPKLSEPIPENQTGIYSYGRSNAQINIHRGGFLHDLGFRGEGMQWAVLDGGFYRYNELPTFDSVRLGNRILGTWDFVNNELSVSEDHHHGMQCFSVLAANIPSVFVGAAPAGSYYLFRTENVNSEFPIEEHFLAAGLERADSLGVPISSISLGYTQFDNATYDYDYTQMNGNTSISSRAVDIAAAKGMLVTVAQGNEGNNNWHFLSTPADADSALTIGAVDTAGISASFSGYGPSSDGQIKPTVASVGSYVVVANTADGLPVYGFGTSFACPNMSGIAGCLWQAFPEVNNMQLITTLKESATQALNPDDRQGYGIPDARDAFVRLQKMLYQPSHSNGACFFKINATVKRSNNMLLIIERKLEPENGFSVLSTIPSSQSWGFQNFTFTDNLDALRPGLIQYRIKMQIGQDTTYTLDSLSYNHTRICFPNQAAIQINPNPVRDNINLRLSSSKQEQVTILIHNSIGQLIQSQQFVHPAGTATYTIPFVKYSSGVYAVTVYFGNEKKYTETVVQL